MRFLIISLILALVSSCAAPIPTNELLLQGAHQTTSQTKTDPPSQIQNSTIVEHHGLSVNSVEPEKALSWLKNGNIRFTKNYLRKDGQSKNDIAKLTSGQKPHSIVLSCSDSRVPPEIVFDQKLGEIFTVRTAGEALASNAIASIEYAIEHLGARLILVMGHTSCGAVKTALGTMNGEDAGSPHLNELVKDIHPRLVEFKGKKTSAFLKDESWANTLGVGRDLMAKSKLIEQAVKSGKVKIETAIYNMNSGQVEFENR